MATWLLYGRFPFVQGPKHEGRKIQGGHHGEKKNMEEHCVNSLEFYETLAHIIKRQGGHDAFARTAKQIRFK